MPTLSAQDANAPIAVEAFDDFAVLTGRGGNIIALPGPEGALLIDGGHASEADEALQAAFSATRTDRISTLINTHWHPEQTGLNVVAGELDAQIIAHEKSAMYLRNRVSSALYPDHIEPLIEVGQPGRLVRLQETLEFADVEFEIGYLPAAHTDGDLYVHAPDLGLLAVGGVMSATHWSRLDYRNGAWFGGRVRALEWLASIATDTTIVVAADGPVLQAADIVRQRDICLELFEAMIGYMNRGFGPEDAVAAGPLDPYADEYGDPATFIDEAFRSMLIAYVPD